MKDINPFELAWGVFAVPFKPYRSRIGHVANNEQRVKGEERGGSFFFFLSFRSNLGFTHVNPTWVNGNGSDCCAGQLRHPVSSRFFCFVFP